MKKSRIIQLVGCALILCSVAAVAVGAVQSRMAEKNARQIAEQIQAILPPVTPGITDQYSVMEMPVLELEGEDYIALVQVPAFGVSLPVRSGWSGVKIRKFPCRFHGTVYDGSLIIGGSDQQGQLDFLTRIQLGDAVLVTDMTGAQFTYKVSHIGRSSSASAEILMDETVDLTLFARVGYSMEYILVRCVADASTY